MIKRTIKETIREYDASGRLLKETVTETSEDDDTVYPSYIPNTPYNPVIYGTEITCNCNIKGEKNEDILQCH